jgi:hypothetical protein
VNRYIYTKIPNNCGDVFSQSKGFVSRHQTDTAVLQDISLSFILQFKIYNDVSSEAVLTRADETELLNDLLPNNKA